MGDVLTSTKPTVFGANFTYNQTKHFNVIGANCGRDILVDYLKKPQVKVFIYFGHGGSDANTPFLSTDDESGLTADEWGAKHFDIVSLNGCYTEIWRSIFKADFFYGNSTYVHPSVIAGDVASGVYLPAKARSHP